MLHHVALLPCLRPAEKPYKTFSIQLHFVMSTISLILVICQAYVLRERGSLLELVDPALGSEYSSEEAMVMLNVALLCTNASPTLRPTMSQVVSMLEGRTAVQDILSDPGFSSINSKFKALVNHFWQNPSQTISLSSNGPKTNSSSSNIEEAEDNSQLLRFSSVQSEV